CAAALAVLDTIEKDGLLDHVTTLGDMWSAQLRRTVGVRGRGLWLALEVADGLAPAVEAAARDAGFLVNATGPDAVRLAPPLVLTEAEATSFADALPSILGAAADAVSVSGVK